VRTTQGRSRVSVLEIAPGPGVEAFRIVQSGDTLTLWADPVKLRDVATDIEIVS